MIAVKRRNNLTGFWAARLIPVFMLSRVPRQSVVIIAFNVDVTSR